jgi:peptidyl-prolyl cis-trans isomerase SurA
MMIALLFVSLVNFPTPSAHARVVDKTIAQVNGEVLLASDLKRFQEVTPLRREVDPFWALTGGPNGDKAVTEYLMQERLVLQKYPASEAEIEEEINAVQRNNRIDRARLQEVLRSQGVKFEDYKKLMAVSLSKRKLIERELRPLAIISDEDVKNFYYTDPRFSEQRKSQQLELTYSLQQMILPSPAVAAEADRRMRNGEDFDSVVADLAARGVETSRLNALAEGSMNPRVRQAIQGLKVGESTKPLDAGAGQLILKVLEIGAPKDPEFERQKEALRSQLFQRALQSQLKNWTEKEKISSFIQN